jgi:hypothetical protein
MDGSEELASAYLKRLGLGGVAYEPDGQIPPDFVVGDIGVEVRRLNQNHETSSGYEGLESGQASILRYLEKLLPTYGPPQGGQGWWVFFTFRRPLDGKEIKRLLPKALADFQAAPHPYGMEIRLTQTFELEIRPAGVPVAKFFMLGAYADHDQGGFIVSEMIRNLNICITEKAAKIAPYQTRYREWWLVLPDYIGLYPDADERRTIAEHVRLLCFSQVVLIHPNAGTETLLLK